MGNSNSEEVDKLAKKRKALEIEYHSIRQDAIKYAARLEKKLQESIENSKIKLGFPVASRIKEWNSIEEKIDRLAREFSHINDIQDVVGVRIIVLFLRDVDKLRDLIVDSFDVKREYNNVEQLDPKEFEYSSLHIVLSPSEQSSKSYPLMAEIQIRTVAQHLWAEVSRVLQYKTSSNVPKRVLRPLFRTSALLETVDLEFERTLEEREIYRKSSDSKDEDKKLNSDNLELLLDELLPLNNKTKQEMYSDLVRELSYFNMETPKKVQEFMLPRLDGLLSDDKKVVAQKKESVYISQEEKDRIEKYGVFFSHTGLVRKALDDRHGREWRSKVFSEKAK